MVKSGVTSAQNNYRKALAYGLYAALILARMLLQQQQRPLAQRICDAADY